MFTALTAKKTLFFTCRLTWALTVFLTLVAVALIKVIYATCLEMGDIVFGFRIF